MLLRRALTPLDICADKIAILRDAFDHARLIEKAKIRP
jgi:hypothetical protein